MSKHTPTVIAEASLQLHKAHASQAAWADKLASVESVAREQLQAEGKPLTVRNIVTRQFELAAQL